MIYKQFGHYYVYENGDIYSLYSNKILKPDKQKTGYLQVTLYENGKPIRYKVHRLVGILFLNCPENYNELQINHIDGNKENNHYSNLEWCTSYENNKHAREKGLNNIKQSNHDRWQNKKWANKVSKKISQTVLEKENNKGKKNPNFRYLVIDENNNEYSRQELSKLFNFSLAQVDRRIRNAAQGKICPEFKDKNITVIDIKSEVNRLSKE